MTYEQVIEFLDVLDEKCLAKTGQSLGLGVCGAKHAIAISFEQVLWDSADWESGEDPIEDHGGLRQKLLNELRDIAKRITIAIEKLEADDEACKGEGHEEPEANTDG